MRCGVVGGVIGCWRTDAAWQIGWGSVSHLVSLVVCLNFGC
jgi:hypothetical protein